MSIAERLLQIRKESGMSQRNFAEKLRVSKGAISCYENGKQLPGSCFILEVCDNFNIEPRWLLKGEGQQYDNKTILNAEDLHRHDVFMNDIEQKTSGLKAEIERLKSELLIVQLERDRAQTEAYKATKAALKLYGTDIDKD